MQQTVLALTCAVIRESARLASGASMAAVLALLAAPAEGQSAGASRDAGSERAHFLVRSSDGPVARSHRLPAGAPFVAVLAQARAPQPDAPVARAVIYLHGWNACVRVLALEGNVSCIPGERALPAAEAGWGLFARAAAGDPDVPVVLPQLAWNRRSGNPGAYRSRAAYDALWTAVRAQTGISIAERTRITIVAHSAGYETALAMLTYDARIDEVVLFDSMYAGAHEFASWVLRDPHRKLVSVHTGRGGPEKQTKLAARLVRKVEGTAGARSLGAGEPVVLDARFTAMKTKEPHREIPVRLLESVLRALREAR